MINYRQLNLFFTLELWNRPKIERFIETKVQKSQLSSIGAKYAETNENQWSS